MRATRKSRASAAAVYDDEHYYVIDRRDDPAYPGVSPEPVRTATVAGVRGIPAARSWAACAEPVHHDLVAELLRSLPERRLLRIVGYGDQSDAWLACSDGPDGVGSWLIPYDTTAAAHDLAATQAARPGRSAARRVAALIGGLAAVALAAWIAVLLDANHASDHARTLVALGAGVAVVVALGAVAVLARRRTLTSNNTGKNNTGKNQSSKNNSRR